MQDDDDTRDADGDPEDPGHLSLWQVIGSTLASAFGVQSSRNRERDFKRGRASHFIIAGILFTALFVLTMVFVVKLVLSNAG
jgi:hypothetical protein